MKVENTYRITTAWGESFFCDCYSMNSVISECESRGLDPTQYTVRKIA